MVKAELSYEMLEKIKNISTKKLILAADKKCYLSSAINAYDFGFEVACDAKGREVFEVFVDAETDEDYPMILVFFGQELEILDRLSLCQKDNYANN